MKKPLSRLESARAIIAYYDDLTNAEIKRLPAVERELYLASIDFIYSKGITRERTFRKGIRRTPLEISKVPRQPAKSKRRQTAVPPPARKKRVGKKPAVKKRPKTLVDEYPELDILDKLDEMIAEVKAADTERYHSQ